MAEFDDVLAKIKEWKEQTSEVLIECAKEFNDNPLLDQDLLWHKYMNISGQNQAYQYFLARADEGRFKLLGYGASVMDPETEARYSSGTEIEKLWSDISSRDDWFRKDSEKFFNDWRQAIKDNFSKLSASSDLVKQLGMRDAVD